MNILVPLSRESDLADLICHWSRLAWRLTSCAASLQNRNLCCFAVIALDLGAALPAAAAVTVLRVLPAL